jgi:phospholipid transport system substrate-binding protein
MTLPESQSLFGSFSSEKEDSVLFLKKKNQKDFISCAALAGMAVLLMGATAEPAAAPVEKLDQGLMDAMKNGGQPFPARYAALGPVVDQAFNLPQILKTIVGLRWSSIPADQQTELLGVFRAYTVANYTANFNTDSGDTIKLLPETRSIGADKVIETEIVPKSGDPIRMDYVMREGPAGWQAVDVLETGTISQVAVQRSDFRSLLANGAQPLIDSLKAKVDKLSGGTVHP